MIVAQLDANLTGKQEVVDLTPPCRQHSLVEIDHEMFLSLPLIQEGSCQFLVKECAQYWLTT